MAEEQGKAMAGPNRVRHCRRADETRAFAVHGAAMPAGRRHGERSAPSIRPGGGTISFPADRCAVRPAQPSPGLQIEHIIFVLEGAFLFIVFIVDGVEHYVDAMDQISVPVGVRFEYLNASLGQSMFLSMVGVERPRSRPHVVAPGQKGCGTQLIRLTPRERDRSLMLDVVFTLRK